MTGKAWTYFSVLAALAVFSLPGRPAEAAGSWLDRSYEIFVPREQSETLFVSQSFPVFWWNFVVLENIPGDGDWSRARALCTRLKSHAPETLARVECAQGAQDLAGLIGDWAGDLPLREARPSAAKIAEKFDQSLAEASLPGADRGLLALLRTDPLESWRELQNLAEKRLKIPFERKNGFFYDPDSHRVLIPVQAAYPPREIAKTRAVVAELGESGDAILIGPHASTLSNEEQVSRDLNSVSLAGYAVLAAFGGLLIWLRRARLLILFPPILLAVGLGVSGTILIFGSIHGLTLSLGAGLIGLTLDYGFNAAFNHRRDPRRIWRSNLMGVATTLVGLAILATSSIPLLRQMMVFSSIGLLSGFVIIRVLFARSPAIFATSPAPRGFAPRPFKTAIVGALLVASVAGFVLLRPDLDMKQFDFQETGARETAAWLYRALALQPPLFTVTRGTPALETAHREAAWAKGAGIAVENLAQYLPERADQQSHLASWDRSLCAANSFTETQRKFFAPFLERTLCSSPQPRGTAEGEAPALRSYDRHLNSEDRWLTLWLPSSPDQERAVREKYPTARSLKDVISIFPQTLSRELRWMAPLSLLIVFGMLVVYYRRLTPSLAALIPFFSGLGLFTLAVIAFRLQMSFISVIALVMCFGFSFDYAIFSVDERLAGGDGAGVWAAITSAASATLAGFLPLLFCKHPVLAHLGQALCISTIGCYLGAVWGIPGLLPREVSQ